jgi:hypothetical protein
MHLTVRLLFWVEQPLSGNNDEKRPRFTSPGTTGTVHLLLPLVYVMRPALPPPGPVNRDGLPTLPLKYVMRLALPLPAPVNRDGLPTLR